MGEQIDQIRLAYPAANDGTFDDIFEVFYKNGRTQYAELDMTTPLGCRYRIWLKRTNSTRPNFLPLFITHAFFHGHQAIGYFKEQTHTYFEDQIEDQIHTYLRVLK